MKILFYILLSAMIIIVPMASAAPPAKGGASSMTPKPKPAIASKAKGTEAPKPTTSPKRGGNTAAAQNGKTQHRRFQEKYGNKPGRVTELRLSSTEIKKGTPRTKRISGEAGRGQRLDMSLSGRRPVELKPDTTSGRQAMKPQIRRYERSMGKRGVSAYYDKQGNFRFERSTRYSEWKARPEVRVRPRPRFRPIP